LFAELDEKLTKTWIFSEYWAYCSKC
jgi:hypothetical protein